MRLVLDTNVLVSGFLRPTGSPRFLLERWLTHNFVLVSSDFQLRELDRVLGYDHLRGRFSEKHRQQFLECLDQHGVLVDDGGVTIDVSPDPDDNRILAAAVVGRADLIVSGDKKHMLAVQTVRQIPIISPQEAVLRLAVVLGWN